MKLLNLLLILLFTSSAFGAKTPESYPGTTGVLQPGATAAYGSILDCPLGLCDKNLYGKDAQQVREAEWHMTQIFGKEYQEKGSRTTD